MGKKATIAIAILISLVVGVQAACVEANPISYGPPRITLVSPQYGKIYNSSEITLSTEIQLYGYTYTSLEVISSARYAVDNGVTHELTLQMPTVIGPGTTITSTDILPDLPYGIHTVTIFLETTFGESATANTSFTLAPKPSEPDFSVSLVGPSSVEVTIRNQPLNAFQFPNGSYPNLYYGFRFWDHQTIIGGWEYVPEFFVGISSYGTYYQASNSDYTVVKVPLDSYLQQLPSLSTGGQIDFQAMALIGNEYPTTEQGGAVYGFDGEESVWSTQTIVIPEPASPSPSLITSPTPSLSPTPSFSPTQQPTIEPSPTASPPPTGHPSYTLEIIGTLVIVIVIIVVLLYLGKKRKV